MNDLDYGMVDLHCHILPGIDDGSPDLETSLEMAQISAESGVTDILCTPHCIPKHAENYKGDTLTEHFHKFKQAVEDENIPVRLHLGTEVYGCEYTPRDLENNRLTTINNGRYMLIEFNFVEEEENVMEILSYVEQSGIIPVIAHPERYKFVAENPSLIYKWLEKGYPLQCNKDSILGRLGRVAFMISNDMLHDRLICAIASDAHGTDMRNPYLKNVYNKIADEIDIDYADLLFYENPRRIIDNKRIIIP